MTMNCRSFLLATILFAGFLPMVPAQALRLFRVAGPVSPIITSISADGYLTWTNVPTNAVFTVQTAAQLTGDWTDWAQVPVTNSTTIYRAFDLSSDGRMAFIPPGQFQMGDALSDSIDDGGMINETPVHDVYVSAFYMDRYEVSYAFWEEVRVWGLTNGYLFFHNGFGKASNHPVVSIAWLDCIKWCNARSEKAGLTPSYYYTDVGGVTNVYRSGFREALVDWNANGFRLPTDAEWEKAARGGAKGRRFPWSDNNTIAQSRANYFGNPSLYDTNSGFHPAFAVGAQPYTSPVGYFAPNSYGLYDMAGNVAEWCWDWYDQAWYTNSAAADADTRGPIGNVTGNRSERVTRNGGWSQGSYDARVSHRKGVSDYESARELGFRCARTP